MSNTTSEKLTFSGLISKHKIEIPIIQRDYAQGREGKEELRKSFLTALLKAVNGTPLELDFVYGSVKQDDNGITTLQPLDGQQRLTTLFLLHWFIAIKENKLDDEIKDLLSKFTYETRTSSREFCNDLINKGIDFNKLLETDYYNKEKTKPKNNELSKTIIDSSWFFLSWKKDPTIKSMLTMLDAIQQKFKNETKIWDELNNISFHYIELKHFGLSDDLYIKMNARGNPLTDFENFKAKFEKYIKEKEFENGLSLIETFSHKIDTVWTDLFWKHRGIDNLLDNEFVKFIAGIAINSYAENLEIFESVDEDKITRKILEDKKEKNITVEAIKRERIERRITLLFNSPNKITPEDFPKKISFDYLKSCLDIYSHKEFKYDELKPEGLELWDFLEIKKFKINSEKELDNNLFIDFIKDVKTEYKQRILFYAQTQFLFTAETFNSKSFAEWMRVVRNIVQNATIDSAGTFIGAIGLIKELSAGCTDIYNFLSKHQHPIKSGFASNQVKEEILKSSIIIADEKNKEVIFLTEDTNFCKGKIKFPLYCIDYDIENVNLSEFDISKLKKVLIVIDNNFANLNIKLSDEFKRAFLTIKNNNYYDVWGTWSYSFNSNKRWLLNTVSDLKNNFSESRDWKREYLKELFVLLWSNNFSQIIDKYHIPSEMPEWKKKLIQNQNLLEGATFILIPESNNYCELAWQQKPSRENRVKKIE